MCRDGKVSVAAYIVSCWSELYLVFRSFTVRGVVSRSVLIVRPGLMAVRASDSQLIDADNQRNIFYGRRRGDKILFRGCEDRVVGDFDGDRDF